MMLIWCFTLCFALTLCAPVKDKSLKTKETTTIAEQPEQHIPHGALKLPKMAPVDKVKVQKFFSRWCKYFKEKDISSMTALYAEDLNFIMSGKDAAKKQAVIDDIKGMMDKDDGSPCIERLSLISGDYYYPYYWGYSFSLDKKRQEVPSFVFSDTLRLKENGDYEIVLANIFKVPEGTKLQTTVYDQEKDQESDEERDQEKVQEKDQVDQEED